MERKKLMLLVLMGLLPLVLGFKFGSEIKFDEPTKFQADTCSGSSFDDMALGDVDGDGDLDLIVIKNSNCDSYVQHQVRVYYNQYVEEGGDFSSGSVVATNLLFMPRPGSGLLDTSAAPSLAIDADGRQKMQVIYSDGTMTVVANKPRLDRYYTPDCSSQQATAQPECCNNATAPLNSDNLADTGADVKAPLKSLAVAYKTVTVGTNTRRVVDYIMVSREYQGAYTFYYNAPWHYAGRIIHLKNPIDANGNFPGGDKFVPWQRWDGSGVHPGHANNFSCNTINDILDWAVNGSPPSPTYFYNDDYAFQACLDASYGESWSSTFNNIALADVDKDGDYDLWAAPVHKLNNYQNTKASLYLYVHGPADPYNFNSSYTDANGGGSCTAAQPYNTNYKWGGAVGSCAFWEFRVLDMDMDGTPDLVGYEASKGSFYWALGSPGIAGSGGSFATSAPNKTSLDSGGTMQSFNAAYLRSKDGTAPDTNKGRLPDLVCSRPGQPRIDVSMYSDWKKTSASPYPKPSTSTLSEWINVYTVPADKYSVGGPGFKKVAAADVDGCGMAEIIALTTGTINSDFGGVTAFWIFKNSASGHAKRYLTMRAE